MADYPVPGSEWTDFFVGHFLRFAAGGLVPARWFEPGLPAMEARSARTGTLRSRLRSTILRVESRLKGY